MEKSWTFPSRVMIACCNDGTRPVIFKLERIDIPETEDERAYLEAHDFACGKDAAVFAMTGATPDGWRRDPYDPKRTAGNLMNLSELPEYDPAFPQHPPEPAEGFCRKYSARQLAPWPRLLWTEPLSHLLGEG